MDNTKEKRISNMLIDASLWLFSILMSSIPVFINQFFDPSEEFVDLSIFYRLLSDINFAYAFVAGGVVLTIQVLLTMRENEYISNMAIKILGGFSLIFYILAVIVYTKWLSMDYNEVNKLLQSAQLSGSVLDANKTIICTTLIMSFVLGFLHSIPEHKENSKSKNNT